MNSNLTDVSRYVYGTTRLGDESISFEDRLAIVREAVDAGLWIHTSHQYGDALRVLRALFDEDRSKIPPAIFKLGNSSPEEVRGQVVLQLEAVGTSSMAIGQVFPSGQLAEGWVCRPPYRGVHLLPEPFAKICNQRTVGPALRAERDYCCDAHSRRRQRTPHGPEKGCTRVSVEACYRNCSNLRPLRREVLD